MRFENKSSKTATKHYVFGESGESHLFLFVCPLLFSLSLAGLRYSVRRALVGERVRLPADQPEAVRPAGGADRLGRTAGFLAVRPLPDWQRETKLQVRPAWTALAEQANVFFRPGHAQSAFRTP